MNQNQNAEPVIVRDLDHLDIEVTDLPNGSMLVGADTADDAVAELLAFAARIEIHTH